MTQKNILVVHHIPGKVPASKIPRASRNNRNCVPLRMHAINAALKPHNTTMNVSHLGAPTLA
jgi:hypothetical protein